VGATDPVFTGSLKVDTPSRRLTFQEASTQMYLLAGVPNATIPNGVLNLQGQGVGQELSVLRIYAEHTELYGSGANWLYRGTSGVTAHMGHVDLTGGGTLRIGGNQVVGQRGAAINDVAMASASPTKSDFDALANALNTLLARMRAGTGHGLIA
jgi:hypothetical protein